MSRRRRSLLTGYLTCLEHGCPALGTHHGRCGRHWDQHRRDATTGQLELDLEEQPCQ